MRKPCLYCGHPVKGECGCSGASSARAARSARREETRPSRQARGYGASYASQRRELGLAIHKSRCAGRDVFCVLCGNVIHGAWTAEHDPPLSSVPDPRDWRGRLLPAHGTCNSARRNTR